MDAPHPKTATRKSLAKQKFNFFLHFWNVKKQWLDVENRYIDVDTQLSRKKAETSSTLDAHPNTTTRKGLTKQKFNFFLHFKYI